MDRGAAGFSRLGLKPHPRPIAIGELDSGALMRLVRLMPATALLRIGTALVNASCYIKPVRYLVRGFIGRAVRLIAR